jgi:hypothetical protein
MAMWPLDYGLSDLPLLKGVHAETQPLRDNLKPAQWLLNPDFEAALPGFFAGFSLQMTMMASSSLNSGNSE